MADLYKEVRASEEMLLTRHVRKAAGAFSELLADDFLEIGASGARYDKAGVIGAAATEDPVSCEISNYRVQALGQDYALATYDLEKVGVGGCKQRSRRSSIWKSEGDAWRLLFHQGTVLSE